MKNKGLINAINAASEKIARDAAWTSRMQTLDKATIALGRLGYTPQQLADFEDEFCKVEQDYCEEVLTDAQDDKELTYAKYKIDKAIQQYVLPERFVDYDTRYRTENKPNKALTRL